MKRLTVVALSAALVALVAVEKPKEFFHHDWNCVICSGFWLFDDVIRLS
ncbi:hypothetical protein Plim_1944 [Planctopirus limnophila DSM 3776]|uniref:Uncharacterized protein n=1 Tax=Planctopirus limnophila (strain ATCC 43296 / DSM 3776 / IFAM 1008 / Mu 290) TaxID=521674 RepID=D5SXT7_PLAL2|nr:hypothetical protein [Planctopirus limnophila]ADG67774.1 hypothetical protein Plim_1944 [Planctopirus limnophila DSM 3776]